MNLELLANELLLELFGFLNSVHLLRAFSDLNSRFDTLLIVHFRVHALDFQTASRHDFDIICRENLPSIADRIIALRLSNDHDTPYQINLFLSASDGFTLRRFIHLQSLSFYHLCSNRIIKKIVLQCHDLPHLTQLNFIDCFLKFNRKILLDILNHIWSLSKLKHCQLGFEFEYDDRFPMPTIVSNSIEYLSIRYIYLHVVKLARLFRYTPNIQHLIVRIKHSHNDKQLQSTIPSMTSLKLAVVYSEKMMTNLLAYMPNLSHLTIEKTAINIDGHQWKQIIVEHLPKLKVFRFEMRYPLDIVDTREEEIDRILDSYRTPFWLIEHRWFVRCRWEPTDDRTYIFLYTLPYAFDAFIKHSQNCNTRIKSTCPRDNEYLFHDRVTTLFYQASIMDFAILPHDRFNKIQHSEVELPFYGRFLSDMPQFDQLTSLVVKTSSSTHPDDEGSFYEGSGDEGSDDEGSELQASDDARSQLQALIDRAPRLYSLTIYIWSSSIVQQILSNINSRSIRRLDLQSFFSPSDDCYFNSQQCATFIRSPLAIQCEILQIVVENRTNILDIVHAMTNLRALHVQCLDDKRKKNSSGKDKLVEWLRSRLSCIITRDIVFTENIQLWIR
jgi:hypothetical protein